MPYIPAASKCPHCGEPMVNRVDAVYGMDEDPLCLPCDTRDQIAENASINYEYARFEQEQSDLADQINPND